MQKNPNTMLAQLQEEQQAVAVEHQRTKSSMDALAVRYNQLDGAIAACRAMADEAEEAGDEEAALAEAAAYTE